MHVLIACEFTGIVREAFKARGHNVYSCDLLPTEIPGNHIQGDVLEILNNGWDLMIAFPPCQYLSNAGNGYWDLPGRDIKRVEAAMFFFNLWNAPIAKIAIENPVNCLFRIIKPTQIIQPYYFGDNEHKKICLWLKNLKPLVYAKSDELFMNKTAIAKPDYIYIDKSGQGRYKTDAIFGWSKDATKNRSRFFPGVAKAMAEQWG
jgi:hypothetical protein